MVTVPATVDLSPVDAHLPLDANLSFTRPQIGGNHQQTVNHGVVPSRRHLCLVTGMNVVPRTPGEPLLVFSVPKRLRDVIKAARKGSAHGHADPSINIFVQHGKNDWRYRGAYEVRELEPTAEGETDRFIGTTPPGGLVDVKTDPAKKELFRDLLRRFKIWSPGDGDFAPWGMELLDAEEGLRELETKQEVGITFLVLTYAGWDQQSLDIWSAARAQG